MNHSDATTVPRVSCKALSRQELADLLGLARWQIDIAYERGMLPLPDRSAGKWSGATAAGITAEVPAQIRATLGDQAPLGIFAAADQLTRRTGITVAAHDIRVLAAEGHLPIAWRPHQNPLFSRRDLDSLDPGLVERTVQERLDGNLRVFDGWTAARRLGWRQAEFIEVAKLRCLPEAFDGMWHHSVIEALAADDELNAGLTAKRLLGANEAAARLGIRRTDWDLIVTAGWIAPAGTLSIESSRRGRRVQLTVPGYLAPDIDRVLEEPDIDWPAVQATTRGRRSPLLDHIRRPRKTGDMIRAFCAAVSDEHRIAMWPVYSAVTSTWTLDWTLNDIGQPTLATVEQLLANDASLTPHLPRIALLSQRWATVHWAQRMLQPGTAVIVDTETTDLPGAIVEIGLVDACTGEVLLNSLVNPGIPISAGAGEVHHISDADVAAAPPWNAVFPRLVNAIAGRIVLAYNVSFDRDVITADNGRCGLDPQLLPAEDRWQCIMQARSDWLHFTGRLSLGGAHRAVGDALAAREVLQDIATTAAPAAILAMSSKA